MIGKPDGFTPPAADYAIYKWNTKPNGTGTDFKPGADFTQVGDTTLFAQWALLPNCYMVVPGGEVTFPVARAYTIESNAFTDKLHVGGTYTGAFSAEVVWDDASVIDGTPTITSTGKDAKVAVQTKSSVSGNAVVAIKNSSNVIVWSWHIWVTDYDGAAMWTNPNQTAHTYIFMDRNLGATEAALSLAGRGLLYQWGRKDPFPGGQSGTAGYAELSKFYGMSDAGSITAVTVSSDNNTGAIVESIQNPTTFYAVKANSDWLPALDNFLWSTNGMASGGKTIYDPCPTGWRVPACVNIDGEYPWKGVSASSWTSGSDTGGINGGTNALFPAAGTFGHGSGNFAGGSYGLYWSASQFTITGFSSSVLYFSYEGKVLYTSGNRGNGYSVRCVKE